MTAVSDDVTVRVRLFALAKQLAGCDMLDVRIPVGGTVGDVRRQLGQASPGLAGIMARVMIAVDSEYADDATPVSASSEVACIPPVSGG